MRRCDQPSRAKGRCAACYAFWHRNGRDRVIVRSTPETAEAKLERWLARQYAAEVRRQERQLIREIYRGAGGL